MFNARSASLLLLLALMALAQAPEKKTKEGEFEPYNEAVKSLQANNFTKAVSDLDAWSQKFPETDYKDERTAFYVQAYAGANQPAKALASAAPLIQRDLATVFPGPQGQTMVVRLLFNVVWAISHDPNPSAEAKATGEKAARLLLAFEQPIAGVSPADWQKARGEMKNQANAALLYIATRPGAQAMAKQPPDCAAAEQAYTQALATFPDKAVISYELGRALNCLSKQQPDKLSAAVYQFERAAVLDPTLGDPKADTKKMISFADGAYVTVHGSEEGLDQLKQLVRQAPLPPADFKIRTASEIAEGKRAEFEKSNPQLALWMKIKGALADTDGEQYFANQLKDSGVPQLRGVLVEAKPACRPKELLIAVPLPDAPQAGRPEIRLKLDKPLTGKPALNQDIRWQGVPTEFTKENFLLSMDTEVGNVEGITLSPCTIGAPRKK